MTEDKGLPADPSAELILRAAEEKNRFILNTMEQVLALGDFQKQVDHPLGPMDFIRLTAERANQLIRFDTSAVYTVGQTTSNFFAACCVPPEGQAELEGQFESLAAINSTMHWRY
jgi:hypothetical protein